MRTFWLAVLCNALLELGGVLGSDQNMWQYKSPAYPLMFLLGSLVLWAVVGAVNTLVGSFAVTAAVVLGLTAAVSVIDQEKLRLRREPLLPSDWQYAGAPGFLADMVGRRLILPVAVAVAVLVLMAVFWAVRAARRRSSQRDLRLMEGGSPAPLRQATVRGLAGAFCLLFLVQASTFNSSGNVVRLTYDALGANWKAWSQERNYLGNGFVAGFLYNLDVPDMAVPPGYTRTEMARISDRYAAEAARINADRDPAALSGTNVVLVLSESFSDPLALEGVDLDEDPIPRVRLLQSTVGGRMLAQSIGGGTANMEFEALTGMSMASFPPQLAVPYQMLVPNYDHFPSVVRWMKDTGHKAVALHPFSTEMYRRQDVYRAMGFDAFIHDATMTHRSRLGHHGYISDGAAFAEVRQQIELSDQPLFLNLVTMQNHLPYEGRYDDPLAATGPDGEPIPEMGQYLRGLAYSDQAVGRFLHGLARSPEPTVVVFYGDHLPGIYRRPILSANSRASLHDTPYFVWANTPGTVDTPPVVSPSHFVDLALERVGAEVSPYYALLQELRAELPAVDAGLRYDGSGERLTGDPTPEARRLLRDYRLVQYDLSVGHRWSESAMLSSPPHG